jgi:hypothetical protein
MKDVDDGKFVGALLIDLLKAFDTIPHQLLLAELLAIGCSMSSVGWFHNYLEDHQQRVIQGTERTEWKVVTQGVPQGSCLSPMLFNIFVSNLSLVAQSQNMLFADDITNSSADKNHQIVAQNLIDSYKSTKAFCESRGLVINANKTQLIVFQASGKKLPADYEIELDGCRIKPSTSVKLLGVTLDRYLTFGQHIDNTVKQCHGLVVLARAAPYLCRDLLRLAYVSLIRSHLEYCSAVFASAAPSQLRKLDVIQKIASRVIYGVCRTAHSAPLLQALKFDSLECRRKKHIMSIVDSMIAGDCHPALKDVFTLEEDGSIGNTLRSRIGIGRRRFGIFAKLLYNQA